VAHSFPAGHRIRVAIANASWPLVWPSPELATIVLHSGESVIDLPVRPKRAEDAKLRSLGTPRTAAPLQTTLWRPYHRERNMTRDFATGETMVQFIKDRGHYRIDATGTELAGCGTETYRIRDGEPLSAHAQVDYDIVLRREGEWDTKLTTQSVLTASGDNFLVTVRADAWCDGVRIWSKTWTDRIPRDGV